MTDVFDRMLTEYPPDPEGAADIFGEPEQTVDREALIKRVHEERYLRDLAEELSRQRARREAKRILDAEERGQDDYEIPDPTPLNVLLDEDDEEVEWRIEGVWPRGGHVVLSAGAKSGKTTLTGNIVRALVDGDRLFRVYPSTQVEDGVVAILDYEMARGKVRKWLRDQGVRNTPLIVVWTERGRAREFDLRDLTVRAKWVAKLRGAKVRVWIIDCLSPILSALGIDENNNTEVGRVLDGITSAATEAGVEEVLLIHHMGHGAERSRGASRLLGWPDVMWRIVRKRDEKNPAADPEPDAPRYFAAQGRDVDVREGRLLFDSATRHLTYVEGGRKASEHTDALGKLLVWVRDNPGQSGNAIEKALTAKGLGRNVVRQAVADAKTKGYLAAVTKKSNAVSLEITAAGRSALRGLSSEEPDPDGMYGGGGDALDGGALCACQCYIEPFDVTQGYAQCRPCRIEAGVA